MGRTKRKRCRKRKNQAYNLGNDHKIVQLKKWLVKHGWMNETRLYLRFFPETGRGVSSTKHMEPGNILISVPLDLMITYNKVRDHMPNLMLSLNIQLKMQELLSIFLMVESKCKESFFVSYIESLPKEFPHLSWLCSEEELFLYPRQFREKCETKLEIFKESAKRVKVILQNYDSSIWDEDLFKWCYVMVNTRSVYIDPMVFETESSYDENILLDKPCMALCPFLDMFNHNPVGNTEAICVQDTLNHFYELRTFGKHRKYEQIFISYGAHDNETLLVEYGFFIKGNIMDTVKFDLKEVFNILGVNINQHRFKFIVDHGIGTHLYIAKQGLSFNLQALLFTILSQESRNFSASIFSTSYPEHFTEIFKKHAVSLLKYKIDVCQNEYEIFSTRVLTKSDSFILFEDFFSYWVKFLKSLIQDYSIY